MRTVAVILVVALGCGNKQSGEPAKGSSDPKGPDRSTETTERWRASIVLGANIRDFIVRFSPGAKTTAALEGLTKHPLPLADVTLTAERIAFTLEKPKAPKETWEEYELVRTGDKASGTGKVAGATLQIAMVKLAGTSDEPRSAFLRPQTPQGPFAYDVRDAVVDAPDGGKLAGTLTLPKAPLPAPAVLLWSGSGQQDRDETIFGHKPFLIISDRLTRAGFVVLRLDDRATGATTGKLGTLKTEIDDAGAAIEFLKSQKEVDAKRIGMVVHSTGGMVGPNVALAHPVAFIVSLAGVAIPGRDLVLLQQQIAAKAAGVTVPPEQAAIQKAIGEAAAEGPDKVKKVMTDAVTVQMEKGLGRKPTQEEIDQAIAQPLAEATNPWTLSYFTIDPRVAWKKLSIPVLLVVGDLDSQVPADPTIAALEGAHAKKAAVTTKKLPGLNHLFQHAKTGMSDEYPGIEESFDPATLELIANWLVEHAK